MLVLLPGVVVGLGEVALAVVAHDFEHVFVGSSDVLELDIDDGVDPVLAHQGTKAVLEAGTGEECGLLSRGLTVEVELGGPPASYAVFDLGGEGSIVCAAGGPAEGGYGFD